MKISQEKVNDRIHGGPIGVRTRISHVTGMDINRLYDGPITNQL